MHLLSVPERGKSLQTFDDQRTVSREELVELDREATQNLLNLH